MTNYRPEIDGLRTLAVLPVILYHADATLISGGFVGVDVFFVISGYLITSILISELDEGRFSLMRFYERRARRILPALFTVMICCIPFALAWMPPRQMAEFAQSLIAVVFFVSNMLFFRQSDYHAPAAEEKPLLHTWSLAVEEQYYLFFPILLFILWRFGRGRVVTVLAITAGISLLLSEWGWRNHPTANFYLAPGRVWELFAGSFCAFALSRRTIEGHGGLAAIGITLIVLANFAFTEMTPFPGLYTLVPVIGAALIILFATGSTIVGKALSLRPMVWMGLISYSAYLWHQPIFAFARIRSDAVPGTPAMLALAMAAIGLAYLTWRYIEQPFRTRTPIFPMQKQVFGASAVGISAMAIIGYLGQLDDGLQSRMSAEFRTRTAQIDRLANQRLEAIGYGTCHYDRSETTAQFVANWTCAPDRMGAPLRVAIYGDSHAADKAAVLRRSGLDVIQMTAPGCPLAGDGGPASCSVLRAAFQDAIGANPPDVLILANRFSSNELSARHLQMVVDQWASRAAKLIIASPAPEFYNFDDIYAQRGRNAAKALHHDPAPLERFTHAMAKVHQPENVQVLDVLPLFCELSGTCAPVADGLLLVDYGHLSPEAMTALAPALRREVDTLAGIRILSEAH
ncbi:acyltransferase family protein [Celeribacter arenosi]|uniref:Acyltransferase n=1 Tax=Celeribacter arenosi TaxID=792649 RepID=A0ABP7JRQ3_9RHOB